MSVVQTLIGNVKGPQGATGQTGQTGAQGPAATITVGSTTTTAYGNPAQVTNVGTTGAAILNFVIPQGKPGEATTKMGDLVLDSITTSAEAFPSPQVNDTGKVAFGKIVKFFSDTLSRFTKHAGDIATISASPTTQAFSAGDYLVYNDQLYKVIADIATGGTLTPGTNIAATSAGDQLTSLNESVKDPNSKKEHNVLLVSDSYGTRTNSSSKTFFQIFADRTGVNVAGTVAYPGGGFYTGNLLTAFQDIEGNIDDPDGITDIIILAGANDVSYDYSGIYSGISSFVTYSRATYPNAKIWLGHVGIIAIDANMQSRCINSLAAYHDARKLDVEYIQNMEFVLHNRDLLDSDATHPTAAGVDAIAESLVDYFTHGSNDVFYSKTNTAAPATGAVSGVTATISTTLYNDNLSISGNGTGQYFTINWWNTYISNSDNWLNGNSACLLLGYNMIIGNTSCPSAVRVTLKHVLSNNSVVFESGSMLITAVDANNQTVKLISDRATAISNIKQTSVYAGTHTFNAAVV